VEATPTWFGMLLPGTGERLAAVDAMQRAWTGRAPAHPVPAITRVESAAAGREVAPGSAQTVTVTATGDGPLRMSFELRPERGDYDNHDPGQKAGEAVRGVVPPPGAFVPGGTVPFTAPSKPGPYRLFITLRDAHGGAATANLPFLVRP
jgi:hypothetical protein